MGTLGIYKRVSTDEQSLTGISLNNQEVRGKELAYKLGYDFKVYADEGVSGSLSIDKRPGLKSLIDDIADKKIDAIFVLDLDRLSRGDIIQITIIKNILKENKVKLYDVNNEINLNDINQEFLTDIRSLINNYETKKTSQRIKSVLTQNIVEGKVGGGPLLPFGYKKGEHNILVVNEDEAEVVKLIFKLSLEGMGTKVIANYLNERNIPTKRTSSKKGYLKVRGIEVNSFKWRDSVVYRVLTNTLYKGERKYNDKIYPCPIIIEPNIYDLTQEKLKQKNHFKDTRNKYTYLLKGLIYCSRCKGRYYGHKRENGRDNAYICISKRYGETCGNMGINIDYLNELVLKNILSLEKQVDVFFDLIRKNYFMKSKLDRIEKLKKVIKETDNSATNLLNTVELSGMDPQLFRKRFETLQSKKQKLEKELDLGNKNLGILKEEKSVKEFIFNSIKEYKKYTDEKDIVLFIRNFIDKIYIQWDDDELTHFIAINYKLNMLNDYQLSKELLVNRTKIDKNKKRITKILNENIVINNNNIDRNLDIRVTRVKIV